MKKSFNNGLFVMRHCKTQNNIEHRISGQTDTPIVDYTTDTSILDKTIVKQLGLVIISSPSPRCMHTSELIAKQYNGQITIQPDDRLLERSMGMWEGKLKSSIIARKPCRIINSYFDPNFIPPGGESINSCIQRIEAFLFDLGNQQLNCPVLICGHNQILKILKFQIYNLHDLSNYWGTELFQNGKIERLF